MIKPKVGMRIRSVLTQRVWEVIEDSPCVIGRVVETPGPPYNYYEVGYTTELNAEWHNWEICEDPFVTFVREVLDGTQSSSGNTDT